MGDAMVGGWGTRLTYGRIPCVVSVLKPTYLYFLQYIGNYKIFMILYFYKDTHHPEIKSNLSILMISQKPVIFFQIEIFFSKNKNVFIISAF